MTVQTSLESLLLLNSTLSTALTFISLGLWVMEALALRPKGPGSKPAVGKPNLKLPTERVPTSHSITRTFVVTKPPRHFYLVKEPSMVARMGI